MPINWDAVSAVASSATAIAIAIAYWQLRADHERGRRVLAIEMLRFWSTDLTQRASVARRLVETLDDTQARLLSNRKPFEVQREHAWMLSALLPDETRWVPPEAAAAIVVPEEAATFIRWEVVTYLNKLESVLATWQHGVADKKIIDEQFAYLVSPRDGHYALESFRRAEGEENYPAIQSFVAWLRSKKRAAPPRPPAA